MNRRLDARRVILALAILFLILYLNSHHQL